MSRVHSLLAAGKSRGASLLGRPWLRTFRKPYWAMIEAILAAGIDQNIPRQTTRVRDLEALLKRYRPQRIVELGTGLSTVVFASYCRRAGASLTSFEESGEFAGLVSGVLESQGLGAFAPRRVDKRVVTAGCRYVEDIPECDLVYVDGPSNRIDGAYLDCVDVVDAIRRGARPRLIVVDGRVSSVDAIKAVADGYRWGFSQKYARKSGLRHPDRSGHHTVGVRTA